MTTAEHMADPPGGSPRMEEPNKVKLAQSWR